MKPNTVFGILLEFETETYKVRVMYFVFPSGYDVDEKWNLVVSTVCRYVTSNSPLNYRLCVVSTTGWKIEVGNTVFLLVSFFWGGRHMQGVFHSETWREHNTCKNKYIYLFKFSFYIPYACVFYFILIILLLIFQHL